MFPLPPPAKKKRAADFLTTDHLISGYLHGDRNALALQTMFVGRHKHCARPRA